MLGGLAIILLIAGTGMILVNSLLARNALREHTDARLTASSAVLRQAFARRAADASDHVREVARATAFDRDAATSPAVLQTVMRTGRLDMLAAFEGDGVEIARVGALTPVRRPGASMEEALARADDGRWMYVMRVRAGPGRWVDGGFSFSDRLADELSEIVREHVVLVAGSEIVGSTMGVTGDQVEPTGRSGAVERLDLGERRAYVRFDPVGGGGHMSVAVDEPLGALDSTLLQSRLIGGGVLITIAAVLGWVWFTALARPLDSLRRMASRLAAGDTDVEEGSPRGGEIGAVAEDLRRIASTVTDLLRQEQEMSTFVARAAHELRNPLTSIVGLAETLSVHRDDMEPEEVERCLTALARGCDNLGTLATSLLDISQLDQGRLRLSAEALDAGEMVASVLLAHPPWEGHRVIADLTPGILVLADGVRLHEILSNLLVNAYRYGGENVTITAERNDQVVFLTVADDGPGVPAGIEDDLFEPFVRGPAARDAGGSGLGLAIVRGLAEAQGGAIRYERGAPGSRFIVTLPRARPYDADATAS